MPKKKQDDDVMPKTEHYNFRQSTKRKSKNRIFYSLNSDDSDSSSDYEPDEEKEEINDNEEEMNTREMQKFIQKIFPSKNGKERLKQLEKLDKLIMKNKKKKKR